MQQTRPASDRQSCIDENNTKRRHQFECYSEK